jgi:hypothetical protein
MLRWKHVAAYPYNIIKLVVLMVISDQLVICATERDVQNKSLILSVILSKVRLHCMGLQYVP